MRINFCMLVRSKTYRNVYWVDIINSIPYTINSIDNLFDLISSLVNENNGYSLN